MFISEKQEPKWKRSKSMIEKSSTQKCEDNKILFWTPQKALQARRKNNKQVRLSIILYNIK